MSDTTSPLMGHDVYVATPDTREKSSWGGRLLARTAYVLVALPTALVFFVLVVAGVSLSAGLLVLVGGLFVFSGTVYVARGHAGLERLQLRQIGVRDAPSPAYAKAPEGAGALSRALWPARDPQTWLDLVWSLLVAPVTALAAFRPS